MSNLLCYRVYDLKGLSLTDNAVLFQLAFAVPKDGNTANIAMETLAYRAKCNVRTARRSLRRLEELGYIVSIGEKGRGHILKYVISLVEKPVAPSPVVQPDTPPATNGHKPDIPPPADFPELKSDEELLADLRRHLAEREQQQAVRGRPSVALANLIETTKRKIEKLEQKLEGERN